MDLGSLASDSNFIVLRHRSYLMTKMMMDPSLNETEVMADFIQGWYGHKGAVVIDAYMRAFYQSALDTDTYLRSACQIHPRVEKLWPHSL